MNIEYIIKLWYESKYDYINISNFPVVRSDKEVVCPNATFKKYSKITLAFEIDVIEYLKEIYDNCIFAFITNSDHTLYFSVIKLNFF